MRDRTGPQKCRGDGGAALVEFALIAPLLFLLVFGIIEFGWVFGQHLDVRHGAREASRLIAVNYDPNDAGSAAAQSIDIVDDACDRMDLASAATVTLSFVGGGSDAGNFGRARVSSVPQQLTGVFAPVLNSVTLQSTVETRLEQDATWAPIVRNCA